MNTYTKDAFKYKYKYLLLCPLSYTSYKKSQEHTFVLVYFKFNRVQNKKKWSLTNLTLPLAQYLATQLVDYIKLLVS